MADPLGGNIKVRCQQVGHTLLKDWIPSYSKDVSDGLSPSDILEDILEYQEVERVTLGGVDLSLDFPMAVDINWLNIWEACKVVRDTAGGYLYIDYDPDDPNTRRLWLKDNIGVNKGQQIRLGKNLLGVNYRKDYGEFANRIYPVGDAELLISTKTYTEDDVEPSSDASYGYLTLLEKHGAYKDWTGEGDALPANVTVYKPSGAWDNPTGYQGSVGWSNLSYAYDDNEATKAAYLQFWSYTWTNHLTLDVSSTTTHQVKFPNQYTIDELSNIYFCRIQVDIYYGSAWHNVYDAISTQTGFITATFADQTITGVRIRYYNNSPYSTWSTNVQVSEIYFWNSNTFVDDSSNWVQGENEKTLRCDIGDYTADIGYVIDYTHAAYLIDFTNIASRNDIVSRKISFSASDVDTLLAKGRVRLDEIQEPLLSIEVDMVDLSAEDGREYEKLQLGNRVTVIDEGLGIEEVTTVVSLKKSDLLQPGKIVTEFGNKFIDIIDVI